MIQRYGRARPTISRMSLNFSLRFAASVAPIAIGILGHFLLRSILRNDRFELVNG